MIRRCDRGQVRLQLWFVTQHSDRSPYVKFPDFAHQRRNRHSSGVDALSGVVPELLLGDPIMMGPVLLDLSGTQMRRVPPPGSLWIFQ